MHQTTPLMKKFILVLFLLITRQLAYSQTIRHVLFLGNSYTYVNNLPQLIADIALSNGDTLIFDSNTPGGYTFQLHSTDATSLSKIAQGGWDFVVLQEQSQLPSFDPTQVAIDCLPFATYLDSLINGADSCTETLFYMTWGRKNGDASNCASYPPVCTYAGMQERLRESYLLMSQLNHATVAPVGTVWREVRNTNPAFDLYQADESHPSIYGSYLAACVFYEMIFHKSVLQTTYTNVLTVTEAQLIQNTAHTLIHDSLQQWVSNGDIPYASFSKIQTGTTVQFTNASLNANNYSWTFGDGSSSTAINPSHSYNANGTYQVHLIAYSNCSVDSMVDSVVIVNSGLQNTTASLPKIYFNGNDLIIENINNCPYNLNICDATGRLLYTERFQGSSSTTIKSDLKTGFYLIGLTEIETGKKFTDKLMMK